MPKIQFDLPEDVDKKVSHYMIDNNIERKSDAIIKMLREMK